MKANIDTANSIRSSIMKISGIREHCGEGQGVPNKKTSCSHLWLE